MISTIKPLDETDKKIIFKLREGKIYKEIAAEVYLSVHSIKFRIGCLKERYECKSIAQLVHKLKDEL